MTWRSLVLNAYSSCQVDIEELMADQKRGRSRSPVRSRNSKPPGSYYRNGSDRYAHTVGYRKDGRRAGGGAREDPRRTRRRIIKQMIAEPAEPRSGRQPEERAEDLAQTLLSRRYLDTELDAENVASLLVEAAASCSMQTSVYAMATALCVACGKEPKRPSSSISQDDRDVDEEKDAAGADGTLGDEATDCLDNGPSIGRLVIDGCCHAFSKALERGGFIKAKLLLRFLGELMNFGLVQAQEYGDMLATLCSGFVTSGSRRVQQPCRDMVADMVLSAVLRVGPSLSKAWIAGLSDLMDELRTFMSGRRAPFRMKGLRAIFVVPEDDLDEEKEESNTGAGDRDDTGVAEPVEDSLVVLWDVVSALHDSGWQEDDLPKAIPRLWKSPTIEPKLSTLSSLSLPEDFVTSDTIPQDLTRMNACEVLSHSGMGGGTTSPSNRLDWSYALSIMGERSLFDEDDGEGPASCCPVLLPKIERVVLVEYCKDILACFQPLCRSDGSKVGQWKMLVDQLLSIRKVAPSGCQPAFLITEVVFLAMMQIPPAEHLAISCHRTILELCRIASNEAPAAVSYCTGRLYDELENLDCTVATRLSTWFADHLKNTEFKWPFWKHWLDVVQLQPDHAQRMFVTNALAALVKLSYTDRIKKTLPETLWELLPLDPTPVCPYLDSASGLPASLRRIAADMSSRINDREDVEDLQAWLDGNHLMDDVPDGDDSAPEQPVDPCWRSKMVIQILLHTGQASPTHTFVFLDRYREYLLKLRQDEDIGKANEIAMLDGVAQLWEHSPQWFCLVCKNLLEIGVLTPTSVVKYFFREDNVNVIALSPFMWEVMNRAIALYTDRVTLCLSMLQEAEQKLRAADERRQRHENENDKDIQGREDVDTQPNGDNEDKGGASVLAKDNDNDHDHDERDQELQKNRELRYDLRDAVEQARGLFTCTITGFLQALASALPQYQASGVTDFSSDTWWISMTSYLKASLWLFAAAPGVPQRHLADDVLETENLRILDVNEIDILASDMGCREHVEAIITDLKDIEYEM